MSQLNSAQFPTYQGKGGGVFTDGPGLPLAVTNTTKSLPGAVAASPQLYVATNNVYHLAAAAPFTATMVVNGVRYQALFNGYLKAPSPGQAVQ